MSDRGYIPQPPTKIVTDNGEDAAIQAAMQAASRAQQTADNARQMVLNRDGRLTSLEDVAERFATLQAAAENEHHRLQGELDSIALTPGPQGQRGEQGPTGAKGDRGDAGTTGQAGPQGATGARGETGSVGAKGDTGQSGRDANVQVEYRDGITVPAVTLLTLGAATVDVTVTWPAPFPDANYVVTPQLSTTSAALIGKATATVKSKTTNAAVITVTTTALLSIGALTLSAVAYRKT